MVGISIDLYIYNTVLLNQRLREWGAKDKELNHKILRSCGTFVGDKYILLNNELWECSPYYTVATLFDSAYKDIAEDSFDIFLMMSKEEGINAVDKEEIAEELGFEVIDETI